MHFRHYIFFFLLVISALHSEDDYQIIQDKTTVPILTPSFAEYKTLKLKLANGLEALIISDPKTSKSAATLVVQMGSWSEPTENPGLAHFLEHMLFLGTKKYPIESDYDRYIKEHNGDSNAYTASDHTLYVFSVNNDAFEEALDRFASFFREPLFNPSGVSRELQAINQEFAKNFTDDDVRGYYVEKELSNPKHPFHSFSSGNAETLSNVSQKTLRDWYENHYSANLMHLIVYSPLPIDTLKKLVVQDFKDIPNINAIPTEISIPITTKDRTDKIVYIEPLKNVRELTLTWELPKAFAHMHDTKPAELICHILGHEGPGSLLELLKNEGLAESTQCSGNYLNADTFLISLTIELTEKGLEQKYRVLEECFGIIAVIKQQGIPSYLFEEVKKIDTLGYEYQSREEPFNQLMKLGELLIRENISTFPEHSLIIQKFDPQATQDLLNYLTPNHAWITILAKSEFTKLNYDQKEQWMGIQYTVKPIPPEVLKRLNEVQPNPSLHIPTANPFVPKNITITTSKIPPSDHPSIPHPKAIVDTEEAKIYFAKDTDLQLPQTTWYFEIRTPLTKNSDPTEITLTELYARCLKESLNPFSYSAKLADLNYDIYQVENGIEIDLIGYQDNAEILFDAILTKLKKCNPTKEQFALYKDSLLRQYQNFEEESPLKQSLEIYQKIIYQDYSTNHQKADALAKISYEDYLAFSSHLFDSSYTKGLLYGNIEQDQALRIWNKLRSTLVSTPYPIKDQPTTNVVILPENTGPYYLTTSINAPGNALILGIEDPNFSHTKRAAQQILSKAMNGPFYAALRTKQQTGYIVYNGAEELERRLFSLFAVQSNSHAPRDLLARFELFIEDFLQEIGRSELTKEQFEIIRQSLQTTQEQPPQNISDMGSLLKTLAFKYDGDFDWIAKRIQGYKDLTFEDFSAFAFKFLGKENRRRLAILVEGNIPDVQKFQYSHLKNFKEIRNLSQYQKKP